MTKMRLRHCSTLVTAVMLLMACGCSRGFWRTQADFDALNLLESKQFDPRWDIPRTTVEADPRSRFYDPYDLDLILKEKLSQAASDKRDSIRNDSSGMGGCQRDYGLVCNRMTETG